MTISLNISIFWFAASSVYSLFGCGVALFFVLNRHLNITKMVGLYHVVILSFSFFFFQFSFVSFVARMVQTIEVFIVSNSDVFDSHRDRDFIVSTISAKLIGLNCFFFCPVGGKCTKIPTKRY